MTDNGNKQRPVRKLTVDNFSVIKHAELEFGKITVLIGPQSSGKSLLCKLAYFLEKDMIDIAVDALLRTDPLDLESFKNQLPREFLARFPLPTWQDDKTQIELSSGSYSIRIRIHRGSNEINFHSDFSLEFNDSYSRLAALIPGLRPSDATSRTFLNRQVKAQLNLLQHGEFIDDPVYIPSSRALFANSPSGTNATANSHLDSFTKDFAFELQLGSPWTPNPIAGDRVLESIDHIRGLLVQILGGEVVGRDSSLRFKRLSDGLSLPLAFLSAGTQELLPLGDVIRQLVTRQRDRVIFPRKDNLPGMPDTIVESRPLVYLEEPEANVFPSTQYQIAQLITFLSNSPRLEFSWVITTHSPYILSAFGNLIKAGQVSGEKPGQSKAVGKIIKQDYWIKPNDFRAYALKPSKTLPGKFETESIIDGKTGQIDGDYLDNVSSDIAGEFTQLLEIQYGG